MSNVHTIDGVHEILMEQLPSWFKPVLEYIAIMEAYASPLAMYEDLAGRLHQNFYIQTCDVDTIKYWERIFGFTVRYGDTLDFRRQRIIQRMSQIAPYTVWHLRDRLIDLYGEGNFTLEVNEQACWIKIFVTSDRYGAIDLLYDLIYDIVPTHLYIYANQEVTNYATSDAYHGCRVTRTFEQTISAGGN